LLTVPLLVDACVKRTVGIGDASDAVAVADSLIAIWTTAGAGCTATVVLLGESVWSE
jgi:hypothetical protein